MNQHSYWLNVKIITEKLILKQLQYYNNELNIRKCHLGQY